MKTLPVVLSLAVLGCAAGAVAEAPGVSRPVIRAAEMGLDDRLSHVWPDTPVSLVSRTRGVYLDGYGAVFTAEMIPVNDGTSLMHAVLRPEEKALVKQKKIARMPELKTVLKKALIDAAASLDPVPLDEQVVLEVIIPRYDWEDGAGSPSELIVQAPRRKLLELKSSKGVGMDAAIKLTER